MLHDPALNGASTTVARRTRARRPRTILRLVVVLLLVGLLAAGLIWFHQFKSSILKQVIHQITSQLPTVATGEATMQEWQPTLTATGTLRASQGSDLAAEVAGIVDQIHFQSGDEVPAGKLLLTLRPNDDEAKLAQLQAVANLNQITYQRDLRQLHAQAVAQSTVDTDLGNLRSAQAQVAGQQAIMQEKIVRAPFAGKLGIRQVDLGQYLAAGTAIVTLQALDPIFVDFYLPQQALSRVRSGQAVQVHTDGYPNRVFAGTVTAINSKVDNTSRMVQVRASLGNPDEALLPGMFATVSIDVGAPRQLVTIPLSAVSDNPYGTLVYVVHQDGTDAKGQPKRTVEQRFVTTGDTRGDQVAILKGLAAGDTIVTAGQLKLHNHSAILVNNAVQLPDQANPQPLDR